MKSMEKFSNAVQIIQNVNNVRISELIADECVAQTIEQYLQIPEYKAFCFYAPYAQDNYNGKDYRTALIYCYDTTPDAPKIQIKLNVGLAEARLFCGLFDIHFCGYAPLIDEYVGITKKRRELAITCARQYSNANVTKFYTLPARQRAFIVSDFSEQYEKGI